MLQIAKKSLQGKKKKSIVHRNIIRVQFLGLNLYVMSIFSIYWKTLMVLSALFGSMQFVW